MTHKELSNFTWTIADDALFDLIKNQEYGSDRARSLHCGHLADYSWNRIKISGEKHKTELLEFLAHKRSCDGSNNCSSQGKS